MNALGTTSETLKNKIGTPQNQHKKTTLGHYRHIIRQAHVQFGDNIGTTQRK